MRSTPPSRRVLFAVVLVVVLAGASGAVLYAASSAVEVVADGQVVTTRTFAPDVAAVLDRLEIEVGDADRVEPDLAAPVTDGTRIVVARAKRVEVQIDGDTTRTVVAPADTVADVLREAGLGELLERQARIDPAPDAPVTDGARIVVDLPVPVTVTVDGEVHHYQTYADTVGGALADAGVRVDGLDLVDPPPDRAVDGPTAITVQRVEIVEEVVEVALEHGEQHRETDELNIGQTRVETEGRDGLRREIYELTLIDGEESERELVREEIVREPVDRVVLVGVALTPLHEAQQLLNDLGYPAGPVDGIDGPQTRRGLCAWRRLEGHEVSRQPLQPGELEALRATTGLPAAEPGRGVTVDKTCQALYYRDDGRWQAVHAASTGTDGLPRQGEYRIQRKRAGWHTSTLYPAPEPNMYNSLYIRGVIAIHGSNHVPPRPASAGCVRVTPDTADRLFADLEVGDPVRVIGSY